MKIMTSKQSEQYEIAKDNMDKVNINAHDLRNQISLLRKSMENSNACNVNDLKEELNKMSHNIDLVETVYKTGNKALDITLSEKAKICLNKSIQVSTIADGKAISFIKDIDIYLLLGTALDNAIEANEKIADSSKRMIGIFIKEEKTWLLFI
jgi:archaellum component FlaF (FlaF/FlaG flagellin family)